MEKKLCTFNQPIKHAKTRRNYFCGYISLNKIKTKLNPVKIQDVKIPELQIAGFARVSPRFNRCNCNRVIHVIQKFIFLNFYAANNLLQTFFFMNYITAYQLNFFLRSYIPGMAKNNKIQEFPHYSYIEIPAVKRDKTNYGCIPGTEKREYLLLRDIFFYIWTWQ